MMFPEKAGIRVLCEKAADAVENFCWAAGDARLARKAQKSSEEIDSCVARYSKYLQEADARFSEIRDELDRLRQETFNAVWNEQQ